MRNLQLNPKFLTLIFALLLLLPSCNNEEVFVIEESAIVEEIPSEEEGTEEETPNTEDEVPVVPVDVVDDNFITTENIPIEMVLHTNDTSLPTSGTIATTEPSNGLLQVNNNGTPDNQLDDLVIYTPNPSFSGIDSFEYTICDTQNIDNCDTAIVSITVEPRENDFATELKAFPSAYGAGAYTTGGRGGTVLHVTSLSDGLDSDVGTLRWAIRQTYPRIIVFDVSGVIVLNSLLTMGSSHGNLTIAGQTAPDGGITIDGDRVYINGVDNLIVRHIRFKGGVDADFNVNNNDNAGNDCLSVTGDITNQIFDHCSFAFGADEAGSWYSNGDGEDIDNVTVQRCLFAESSKAVIIGGGEGYANVTGKVSILNNMFYNAGYRFPNATGDGGTFEIINNVQWTSGGRAAQINGANVKGNYIGNYQDWGTYQIKDRSTNLCHYYTSNFPQLYVSGNKYVAQNTTTPLTATVSQMNADNKLQWGIRNSGQANDGDRLPATYFTNTQFPLLGSPVTIQTADAAFADVKSDVGCNARLNADGSVSDNTDVLDANSLLQINNGTYVAKMSSTNYIVTPITSVTRPAGYDTDGDGMADIWEREMFGPDLTLKDGTADTDGDGYTDLEEFLNLVDKL